MRLLALCLATPALAQPVVSANPDLALILDVSVAGFSGEPAPTGAHDPQEKGFNFQQLELHAQHAVDPFFQLEANLAFLPEGVEVEEAFATTLALPGGLQARAGRFLTRLGRLNPTHPHAWGFIDQPLVNGRFFGAEGSRGNGAELSWLSPLPWYAMVYGSTVQGEHAHEHAAEEEEEDEPEFTLVHTLRLEQFFPFDDAWSLTWGLNGQVNPDDHGRTEIYGSDLYLRWRPASPDRVAFSLQIEGFYRRVERDLGFYGQALLDFAQNWQVGGRYEWVQAEEADDPVWADNRRRTSAQLTYFPSHFARLRLQYSLDDQFDDRVHGVMLALETLIGAHGAHEF